MVRNTPSEDVKLAINSKILIAAVLVALVVGVAYGPQIMSITNNIIGGEGEDTIPTTTTETSLFKFNAVKKDATSTSVTGATVRVWYDWDGDGRIDWETSDPSHPEIGEVTESSGVYTSNIEYPIGKPIWIQIYASGYQVTYAQVVITGERNIDGSAKPVGSIALVATDDSITYDGLIRGVAWDDSTDYNYTANGATGTAEIRIKLATQYAGYTSQVWEGVDYMSIYGIVKDHPYYIKWDQGPDKIYAPTFLGMYMTNQDFVDLGASNGDFDMFYHGVSNYYLASVVDESWGDTFYKSTDDSAGWATYTFDVDIGAAGAVIYVGIWQDIEYKDWISGDWSTSATYQIGTLGADWDWVA